MIPIHLLGLTRNPIIHKPTEHRQGNQNIQKGSGSNCQQLGLGSGSTSSFQSLLSGSSHGCGSGGTCGSGESSRKSSSSASAGVSTAVCGGGVSPTVPYDAAGEEVLSTKEFGNGGDRTGSADKAGTIQGEGGFFQPHQQRSVPLRNDPSPIRQIFNSARGSGATFFDRTGKGPPRPRSVTSFLSSALQSHNKPQLDQSMEQQQVGGPPPVNFNALSNSFSQKMNFIKRRFSSSDLVQDIDGETKQPIDPSAGPTPGAGVGLQSAVAPNQPNCQPHQRSTSGAGPPPVVRPYDQSGFSSNKMSSTISAPTSPSKSQPPSSMYTQVTGITRNLFQAATGQRTTPNPFTKDKSKCLLVIDDQHTDWSKYFRGKKVLSDWDIRVEQAEFSELDMASYTDAQLGCLVSLQVLRGGAKVVRQFRPDFVLVRQNVHDARHDWRSVLISLLYGSVPSINSLHSIHNFLDKPWVFAHLAMIQRRLGREKFPLIDQAYYPNQNEMINQQGKFPVVVKIGHAHNGLGKLRAQNPTEFQDVASVVGMANTYCTLEPLIDAKYDIHVQKIGVNYKAFMRKSISGNWKANTGSAMLEQIAMTDRYKSWVDEVAQLFGGLDICAVEAIVGKDGREYIFEAKDCAFQLLGETQEEDRRHIADLVLQRMNHILGVKQAMSRKESMGSAAPANFIKHESPYHGNQQPPAGGGGNSAQSNANQPIGTTPKRLSQSNVAGSIPPSVPSRNAQPPPNPPMSATNPFQSDGVMGQSPVQKQSTQGGPPRGPPPPRPARQPSLQSQTSQDFSNSTQPPKGDVIANSHPGGNPDDTMTNLKKTFAGIFGDM